MIHHPNIMSYPYLYPEEAIFIFDECLLNIFTTLPLKNKEIS